MISQDLIGLFVEVWNEMDEDAIEELGEVRASTINNGWCYQFVVVMQRVYGGNIICSYDHAWLRKDGVDYDSSNPKGASCIGRGEIMNDIQDLHTYWDKANSGPIRDDIIEEVVARFEAIQATQTYKARNCG